MAQRKIVATSTIEKMDDTVSHSSRTSSNAEGSKILLLPSSEKQNIWHQEWDVLQAIEDAQLLDQLQLVPRSNKSIEVRFESERAAQHFVDCSITLNDNSFTFQSNAERRLRVPTHGVHPNISDAALKYELSPYIGGALDIRRDTKQYKSKVCETGSRTFLVTKLYRHIPRSHRIFNRWCLVYYTGQPYSEENRLYQQQILVKMRRSQCQLLTLGQTCWRVTQMRILCEFCHSGGKRHRLLFKEKYRQRRCRTTSEKTKIRWRQLLRHETHDLSTHYNC